MKITIEIENDGEDAKDAVIEMLKRHFKEERWTLMTDDGMTWIHVKTRRSLPEDAQREGFRLLDELDASREPHTVIEEGLR